MQSKPNGCLSSLAGDLWSRQLGESCGAQPENERDVPTSPTAVQPQPPRPQDEDEGREGNAGMAEYELSLSEHELRSSKRSSSSSSSSTPTGASPGEEPMRQDGQFFERLRELEAFKAKYGHCRVPQVWRENKRLGQWVATMRNLKKADKLSAQRIKLLDAVGFVWCCRNVSASTKGEKRKTIPWSERFEELKMFKEKYGHCNVPHKWEENVKLSNWVYCQRSFHRHGKLICDKISRLESIGFEWSKHDSPELVAVKRRKLSDGGIIPSESLYQEHHPQEEQKQQLGAPVSCHEHRDHPYHQQCHSYQHQQEAGQPYPPPQLHSQHQSSKAECSTETDKGAQNVFDNPVGKSSQTEAAPSHSQPAVVLKDEEQPGDNSQGVQCLTNALAPMPEAARVYQEAQGIVCTHREADSEPVLPQPLSVKERKSWNERYEELKAFKEAHGHSNVPWKWKENMPLFYWARRMKDKKRANTLSAEKVRLMEEIGFEWVRSQNKGRERRKQQQLLIEQKQKELEEEREALAMATSHVPIKRRPSEQSVADQAMMSAFTYGFSTTGFISTGTSGSPLGANYYPIFSKLSSIQTSPPTGGFSFDPSSLTAGVSSAVVELGIEGSGQHTLYEHTHGDLAALQQYMGEEEMKDHKEDLDTLHHHHDHDDHLHDHHHHHHHHDHHHDNQSLEAMHHTMHDHQRESNEEHSHMIQVMHEAGEDIRHISEMDFEGETTT